MSMRYWWVNQNKTYEQEVGGGYLWSPKRKSDGSRNHFYDVMREVSPGDIVFSFRRKKIPAIGVATGYARDSAKPTEFGSAGATWADFGWKVPVTFNEVTHCITPAEHFDLLGPMMPDRYAPLQAQTGRGLQGVYLTELPHAFAQALIGLIGVEAEAIVATHDDELLPTHFLEEDDSVVEYDRRLEDELTPDERIPVTERRALILARRGQGLFRRRVLEVERRCRITNVQNPALLQACHMKPWRVSEPTERLDGANGLMLTPTIGKLFGDGFLSFQDDGELLVSPAADRDAMQMVGVPTFNRTVTGDFNQTQRSYLAYHRGEVFREASS
jgi:putative restriction endonuclease